MRATTPSPRRLATVLAALLMAAVGFAGCLQPEESGGGDPDVGPGALHEEQLVDGTAEADEVFRTSVGVTRDTGNVEALIALTFATGGTVGTDGGDPEDANGTATGVNDTPRGDGDDAATDEGDGQDTGTTDGETQETTATVRLLAPTPSPGNGDELRLLEETNVTVSTEEGAEVTIETAIEDVFWDEYHDDAGLAVYLEVEVEDGPVRVTGHLRSFR